MIERVKRWLLRRLLTGDTRLLLDAERIIALDYAAKEVSELIEDCHLVLPPQIIADAIEQASYRMTFEDAVSLEDRADMAYDALDHFLPDGIDAAIQDAEAERDWQGL